MLRVRRALGQSMCLASRARGSDNDMDKTVTGVFPDHEAASRVTASLIEAGFRREQVQVVHSNSSDRHRFIDKTTADARRAVVLGILYGAVGGTLAGFLLAGVLGTVRAGVIGGLAIAAGGAVLGLVVGRSTKSQVQDELEHQVDAGTVLVSVTADEAQSPRAMALLAPEGGPNLVSTGSTFTASVLPPPPVA